LSSSQWSTVTVWLRRTRLTVDMVARFAGMEVT